MKHIIITIFFGFIITSCIPSDHIMTRDYSGPIKVPIYRVSPTLQYRGFSVRRPSDERWYINYTEGSPTSAIFRIEPLSPTHTFNAIINNQQIAIAPKSKEEFKDYIDQEKQSYGPRHKMLSYHSDITERQGQWAVLYSVRILDKAPANSTDPLVMTLKGFVVLHPSWEQTVIDAHYSERGKEDEIDGALDAIGQSLIDGVVLDLAPGVPIKG